METKCEPVGGSCVRCRIGRLVSQDGKHVEFVVALVWFGWHRVAVERRGCIGIRSGSYKGTWFIP